MDDSHKLRLTFIFSVFALLLAIAAYSGEL